MKVSERQDEGMNAVKRPGMQESDRHRTGTARTKDSFTMINAIVLSAKLKNTLTAVDLNLKKRINMIDQEHQNRQKQMANFPRLSVIERTLHVFDTYIGNREEDSYSARFRKSARFLPAIEEVDEEDDELDELST